jgi:hypothetical protein
LTWLQGMAALAAAVVIGGCGGAADRSAAQPEDSVPVLARPDSGAAAGSAVEDTVGADTTSGWTAGDTRVEGTPDGVALLTGVRTARHEGYDRIVYEFAGANLPGYRIAYIDRPVRQCGSGDEVPFGGDAWLSMVFEPTDAHTQEGRPTVTERTRAPALPNVLELKMICDFEAQVEWVAGVRSPLAYRVLTLRAPTRIVVDIRQPAS